MIRGAIFAALLVAVPCGVSAAELLPAARLYGALPQAKDVRLSPDGNSVALISGIKGRESFAIWHLDGRPPSFLTTDAEPRWVRWKTAERLVASVYIADLKHYARPAMVTRLLAFDGNGGNSVLIDLSKGDRYGLDLEYQDRVAAMLPHDPAHILVGSAGAIRIFGMELPALDMVAVDIFNAKVERRDETSGGWVDADGVLRLKGDTQEGKLKFYARADDKADWRLAEILGDGTEFAPLGFSRQDSAILYVSGKAEDGLVALREFNTREFGWGKTFASAPNHDLRPVFRDEELVGYRLGKGSVTYLDPQWQSVATSVGRLLRDRNIEVIDASDDRKRFLIGVSGFGTAPAFWLLDLRGAKPDLSPLFQNYETIAETRIAPTRETSYMARDGLKIPAFLTLPKGYVSGPIPFVVYPHGGPAAHDSGEFDYFAQFLADLGYGVLQPEFRGSTGFGDALYKAGHGQWGRKMQDDVTDGTRWLIEQGYADPARIALVGASFGGYSALMGAVREPDLYRCVAAISPVADMSRFVDDTSHILGGQTGIPDVKDPDVPLAAISPTKHAREIKVPVLLVHGRRDFTVPVEHSEAMQRAMHHVDKEIGTLYLDEADHYFTRQDDRVAMLNAVGEFLDRNLR